MGSLEFLACIGTVNKSRSLTFIMDSNLFEVNLTSSKTEEKIEIKKAINDIVCIHCEHIIIQGFMEGEEGVGISALSKVLHFNLGLKECLGCEVSFEETRWKKIHK